MTKPLKKEERKKSVQKQKALSEKCQHCSVKDVCHGKPRETLDKMLDEMASVEIKREDLPEGLKKFIGDIEGLGVGIEVEAREIRIEPKPKFFCSNCGAGLIERDVPAEVYSKVSPFTMSSLENDAFDALTGKKNWLKEYRCPNLKKNFWGVQNDCDCYAKGSVFTK